MIELRRIAISIAAHVFERARLAQREYRRC
jgi:hypothetical protein